MGVESFTARYRIYFPIVTLMPPDPGAHPVDKLRDRQVSQITAADNGRRGPAWPAPDGADARRAGTER